MGGKGYKPRKDYAGRRVSGDWEDSDRGAGNKATRRAGGEVEAKSPTYIAHVVNKGKKKVDPKKNPVVEAKVDAGLSPEEKEKVRNKRKFGVTHNVAGHAKLRRSLAKMNRGDKKIPGDKSAWTEMESVQVEAEVISERQKTNQGERQSQEAGRSNYGKASVRNVRHTGTGGNAADPAERLVAMDARHKAHKEKRGVKTKGVKEAVDVQKTEDQAVKKMRLIKKQVLMKKLQAVRSGGGEDIVASYQPELSGWRKALGEEGYDRMRDDRLVKYGIGHDGSDRRGSTSRPTGKQPKGKTAYQKQAEKEHGKGATALDIVKKKIEKEHGKGAIYDGKKK